MRLCVQMLMLVSLLLVPLEQAQAHFVWVAVDNGKVCLYFAEDASPGEGHLVDKIAHAEVFVRSAGETDKKLELSKEVNEETGKLQASTAGSTPVAVVAQCQYGVYKNFLLHYFAKYQSFDESAGAGKPADRLSLDVVPVLKAGQLQLTVLHDGKPLKGSQIEITTPNAKHHELTTDDSGKAVVEKVVPGRFEIRAAYTDPKQSGTLKEKPYTSAMYQCTLVLDVGSKQQDAQPTALLGQSRASRAVWDDFPGLTADIVVNIDGTKTSGTVSVSSDGDVELNVDNPEAQKWAQRQFSSLVTHRMPGDSFAVDAQFEDTIVDHPLGRRLKLSEDRMGSIYRIHDNVVRQVNRVSEKSRFTISVIDVDRNPEGKYLPSVFTVSFWNQETGALNFSQTHKHSWKRIGKFDLPVELLEVHSGKDEYHVRKMELFKTKLLVKE